MSWDELAQKFVSEPVVSEDKTSAGWYCPAEFRDNYRDSKNLIARYALTFDYDHIERSDVAKIEAAYQGFAYAIYTTASHTPDKPRVRVVFPLSRPATLEEFCAVTRKHATRFDLEKLAHESDVPAQMMFLPTKRPNGVFKARINEGEPVDVDAVLGSYKDWRDKSEWPRRLQGDSVHATGEKLTPPDEKLGIVGDFCRAFDVVDAIERFDLPYVPGSEGRYTYTEGTRPDGLRLYDNNLKAHSEHDTDPARGQSNAFDLVRIHKFGSLDAQSDLEKPITERPSYKAMCKLAMEQPELQTAAVEKEFVDLGPVSDQLSATLSYAPAAGIPDPVGTASVTLAEPLVDVLRNATLPRWLLRDRLERGVIALMAGPRGSYKSFIATDWGMEVAMSGQPVYTLSAEGADYDRRARAWLKEKGGGRAASTIPMYVAQRRISLNDHDNIELVRQDCVRLGIRPALFILDTFSKLSGGLDENSNTEVKQFIGMLDNGLKRSFDATVLLIAHTGHTDKGRARGASALEADTDAAYIVSRNEALRNVSVTRQRFKSSPELENLWLEPKVVDLGYADGEGQPVTSLVVVSAERPKVEAHKKLTEKQQAAYETVATILSGERTGTIMAAELIVKLAESSMPPPDGQRDTRRQVARVVLEKLAAKGVIHLRKTGHVSLVRSDVTEDFE